MDKLEKWDSKQETQDDDLFFFVLLDVPLEVGRRRAVLGALEFFWWRFRAFKTWPFHALRSGKFFPAKPSTELLSNPFFSWEMNFRWMKCLNYSYLFLCKKK